MKRIPSPSPGEALNVTLLSRLGSQVYLNEQDTYHRPLAEHFSKIHYHENGPVHLKLCHEQETVSSRVCRIGIGNGRESESNQKLMRIDIPKLHFFTVFDQKLV